MKTCCLTTIVTLALIGLTGPSADAVVVFDDFSDTSSLSFNGSGGQSPVVVSDRLRLTQSGNGSGAGSAWVTDPVALGSGGEFEAFFSFSFVGEGDGMAFVLQDDAAGAAALGGGASGMGVNGLSPYVAVIADSFGDPTQDLRIDTTGGAIQATADVDRGLYQDKDADGSGETAFLWVDYDGTTLSVSLSGTDTKPESSTFSADLDLVALLGDDPLFVGFTAGTGGSNATHQVNSFSFVAPVPEPASAVLLALAAAAISGDRGRTRGAAARPVDAKQAERRPGRKRPST